MNLPRWVRVAVVLCLVPFAAHCGVAAEPAADRPAVSSRLAATSPLLGVTRAGDRIVAVGLRGHIVYSDDEGKTWVQAKVPVSSDLVAVSFPSARKGWATGHGGVVLHSSDGGANWHKQLDGKQAADLSARHYAAALAAAPSPALERAARQAKAVATEGNTTSLLDVRFESETSGFVVGTFNRIFRTEDGGTTWVPWMDRTDNPQELHFYSISGDGEGTYLTGERGMVWRLNAGTRRFEVIPTGYTGTLFGLIARGNDLLAYGMRGSLLRSADGGKSWAKSRLDTAAGISGGIVLADGRLAIVTQAGEIRISGDRGATFAAAAKAGPMPYYGISLTPRNGVVLVGHRGTRVEPLP